MKKILRCILAVVLLCTFSLFALGSLEKEEVDVTDNIVGDYCVLVESYRLAKDYEGSDIIIIKHHFENKSDNSISFNSAFEEEAYQSGVELTEVFGGLPSNENYNYDNKTKKIKPGATIEVEIAYELNDTVTDIEVELEEFLSFNDDVITKTFSIQ